MKSRYLELGTGARNRSRYLETGKKNEIGKKELCRISEKYFSEM